MKKHFIPMLVLFAFMMTMQSENILADHAHNEDWEYETRWHKNGKVWGVNQSASDDDIPHLMDTRVRTSTTQDSWTHMMYAEAYFKSRYENPNVFGDYYIHAKLNADWATDQPPFQDEGEIEGKKGGMAAIEGSQGDTDWFAIKDPLETIKLTDAFVRAKINPPDKDVWYRASSKSYFTPKPGHIIYKPKDPYKDDDDNGAENVAPSVAPSLGLSPGNGFNNITINGEEMVDTAPGDTVTVDLVMPSDRGYSQIYWYLAGPNDSGLGNGVGGPTSPSGTGIETEVTHTFSMPSDASGVYTFTAYIYPHSSASDQTIYEYTIKIYCS